MCKLMYGLQTMLDALGLYGTMYKVKKEEILLPPQNAQTRVRLLNNFLYFHRARNFLAFLKIISKAVA